VALEALAQPSLPDQKAMQLVKDTWCHPDNNKMEQTYKARRERSFSRGFITQLRKFHCATRGVEAQTTLPPLQTRKSGHRYARDASSHVVNTQLSSNADLSESKNAEHAGELEAQRQGSAIKLLTCHGCQRILGSALSGTTIKPLTSAQGLTSSLKDL
jgi:hypothetical protein